MRSRCVIALALGLATLAGCTSTPVPPTDAAVGDAHVRGDAGLAHDGGPDTGADAGPPIDAGAAIWGLRSCDVTLRWMGGGSSVSIAGDFDAWAPRAMTDTRGDGTFAITLGAVDGLMPGQLHAYKFIVDGTYVLDPDAAYRKYDGSCLNSAFLAPACDAGPEIIGAPVQTTYDTASHLGTASAHVVIHTAHDGAIPSRVTFTLDGNPATGTLDPLHGAYDVALSGLAPGRHVLAVRATDAMSRVAEPVDLVFWIEEHAWSWRDASMYMIVVDRFANGQTSSDAPVGAPVQRAADYHGGDLQGVLAVMLSGYFESLGVNTLWLSPTNQQATGHFPGTDGMEYAGYHGYWPSRGRTVEPRFGGGDALRALVDEAHRRGIRVLLDLINNQVHRQHEYYTAHPEWFRTGCVCGVDPGCGWSERPLDCLFTSYLPDINWRVPATEQQFIADAVNWIDVYGLDGFRVDAVKHVEPNAVYDLRAELSRRFEQGGTHLYMVGETAVGASDSIDYGCGQSYANGYDWIDAYVGPHTLDGQFDFPSSHRMEYGLVTGTMGFVALEGVVHDMETRYRPEGLHVRFLGTHDTNRIASQASFDPAADCRWPGAGACSSLPSTPTDPAVLNRIARSFTALYAMPGIPFIYYGDEIAMPGGNDPDNRHDMIWEGALSSVAMGGATTLSAAQRGLHDHIAAVARARLASAAMRRGRRVPLVVSDDLYVVAWTSEIDDEVAVVALRRGAAITNQPIDGLVSTIRGSATHLDLAAGTGSATLGTGLGASRFLLTLPAEGSAIFLGH